MSAGRRSLRIACDALLFVASLATLYNVLTLWPGESDDASEALPLAPVVDVGVQMPMPRLWADVTIERTAVLMLDPNCFACLANRSLYRELGSIAKATPRLRFVVLTEHSLEDTRRWLDADGAVNATVVKVSSRQALGFLGTPTLVLTDAQGVVTDIAFGALGGSKAERFKARLRGEAGPEPFRLPYTISEIFLRGRSDSAALIGSQLIDTREPAAFKRLHSQGAVNIPADELMTRAVAELDLALPVYLDCRYDEQPRCRVLASDLGDVGFVKIVVVLP